MSPISAITTLLPCLLLFHSSPALAFVPKSNVLSPQNKAATISRRVEQGARHPHYPSVSIPNPTRKRLILSARPKEESTDNDKNEEEEWFPVDPAKTTPQLLAAVWSLISNASCTLVRGESETVRFPEMTAQLNTPSFMNRFMGHLDACKDVCDFFGTKTILVPYYQTKKDDGSKIQGFTVKSFRNPNDNKEDEYEFAYDPFWDDGDDWDYSGVDAQVEGRTSESSLQDNGSMMLNRIPDDDEEIVETTKVWVDKMMSDMGICPFTSGPNLAGLPMGPVYYCVDRSTKMEDMYARYWKEVVRVEQETEKNLSTTLLIAPEFCMDNIEVFESFSNTLTQPLTALGIEDLLQLVFFHPQWTFRDGSARAGIGAAANYARRSPWPMINILRTSQVRAAQRGIPTGLVYQQNEKTLDKIGTELLEQMLQQRDWSDIADVKVNRRDMEALRVAQDFQQTGMLASEDTSFAYDSTPAANKVDRSNIEGGNMVNVLQDALRKRLGKTENGTPTALSGPETSATVMACDFLLEELDRIAALGINDVIMMDENASDKDKRMSEAKKMILQDLAGDDDGGSGGTDRDEMNVLFGGGGIPMGKNQEEEGGNRDGGQLGAFY